LHKNKQSVWRKTGNCLKNVLVSHFSHIVTKQHFKCLLQKLIWYNMFQCTVFTWAQHKDCFQIHHLNSWMLPYNHTQSYRCSPYIFYWKLKMVNGSLLYLGKCATKFKYY
jgi:hypothetical protein